MDFLKNPEKYKAIGARIPTGALMTGPPGTGKTMLAKACAGEAGVFIFVLMEGAFYLCKWVGICGDVCGGGKRAR